MNTTRRKELIKAVHSGCDNNIETISLAGHFGIYKTHKTLADNFWWPNMKDDVVKFINSCDTCQRCNTRFDKTTNELQSIPDRAKPESEDGYKYIAVAVDYLSKYVVAMPLKDKTAESVSKFFYSLLCTYGRAKIQINDQGRKFVNEVYHKLVGTMQRVTSAYHPQANGMFKMVKQSKMHF
ncbi:unnamed protein product [Gordionus sp. m RMFG-2023]